jgi:hypothetical protein
MLSGRPPFTGTVMSVIQKLATETAAPVRSRNPSVPAPLEAVLMRALARNPAERYATAEEFADALMAMAPSSQVATRLREEAAAGATSMTRVDTPPPVPPETPARASVAVRRPWIAALAALPVIALVVWWTRGGGPSIDAASADALVRESEDTSLTGKARSAKLKAALAKLGTDATHAKRRAELWRRLGRYAKAAEEMKLVDEPDAAFRGMMDRIASNPLRFAAAGTIPLPTKLELNEARHATASEPLKKLLEALRELYSGESEAFERALACLAEAEAKGAKGTADAAVVRAEIGLLRWRWTNPPDGVVLDEALTQLRPLPETPDRLALRAIALISKRDGAAETETDRLTAVAPDAPESYLVRAQLHQGRAAWDEARVAVGKAREIDPALDDGGYRAYLDMCAAWTSFDDAAQTKLAGVLGASEAPLAHLVRAWAAAVRLKWDDLGRHLDRFLATRPAVWLALEPGVLHELASTDRAPWNRAFATMKMMCEVGRTDDSMTAAAHALAEAEKAGDRDARREANWQIARLWATREIPAAALKHVEAALKDGARPEDLEQEGDFATLRETGEWKELMKKYKP